MADFDAHTVIWQAVINIPVRVSHVVGGATGLALAATVSKVNDTTVRVTFNQPVLDNASLRATANYKITGPSTVTISAATPEAVANPTYVDLTISEQQEGETYELEVLHIVGTLE